MKQGATRELASFAASLRYEEMPDEVAHQARRILLDTLGCMLAGGVSHVGQLGLAWVGRQGATGRATALGLERGLPASLAAFANARLAAAVDADEIFPSARQPAHLAVATVGAALAVAESRDRDRGSLLSAIVAGYEVGARISSAMVPGEAASRGLRAGWGPGSVLGATAAAGSAAALNPDAMAHAFGISGMHVDPPPLQWTEVRPGPMMKSADAGWHALTAVASVEMAELGVTGYETILDGPAGLWRALGYAECDFGALTADLGSRWLILDAGLKAWPCQYWMHPAATALDTLIREHEILPEEVERIVLLTNEKSMSSKFHDADPPGEIDRAFSFPHAAAMIVHGLPPGPDWFADEMAERPSVTTLRRKVRVELHPDARRFRDRAVDHLLREMPAAAMVEARGETYRADIGNGRGSPWDPALRLSDDELAEKFRALGGGWVAARATDLDATLAWVFESGPGAGVDTLPLLGATVRSG